jgi:hypothetical protein
MWDIRTVIAGDKVFEVDFEEDPEEGDEGFIGWDNEWNWTIGKCTEVIADDGSFLIDGKFYTNYNVGKIIRSGTIYWD